MHWASNGDNGGKEGYAEGKRGGEPAVQKSLGWPGSCGQPVHLRLSVVWFGVWFGVSELSRSHLSPSAQRGSLGRVSWILMGGEHGEQLKCLCSSPRRVNRVALPAGVAALSQGLKLCHNPPPCRGCFLSRSSPIIVHALAAWQGRREYLNGIYYSIQPAAPTTRRRGSRTPPCRPRRRAVCR